MEEYNRGGYGENRGGYGDGGYGGDGGGSTLQGYKIVIIALAVILLVMSFIFFRQMTNIKRDFNIERMTLNESLTGLQGEYDNLQSTNDTLNVQMAAERQRVDSIMDKLNSERRLSANKIRQYEKEVATLRTVMRGYVKTIDSLNRLNYQLIGENQQMRDQVTTLSLERDKAEESVNELTTRVRQGSVVRVRDIRLTPMSPNDRDINRVNRAAQLRVDFTLSANELAKPGDRSVYVRILSPAATLLANNPGATFRFEGEQRAYTASREIDYQNQDLAVALYYKGSGIDAGTYRVEIYMDGFLLGEREMTLR